MKEAKTFLFSNKIALILFFLIILCISIGISYAYWKLTLIQLDTNVVKTDCLSITFNDRNEINLQDAYPMSIEEKIYYFYQVEPYHFEITNKCSSPVYYTLNLETLMLDDSIKQLDNQYVGLLLWNGEYTFPELIDAMVNDSEGIVLIQNLYYPKYSDIISSGGIEGKARITNLKENEEKVLPEADKAYILEQEYFEGNSTKKYNMFVFMTADTPPIDDVMNARWEGKITLSSTYTILEKSRAQLALPRCVNGAASTNTLSCINDEYNISFKNLGARITKIIIQDEINPIENAIMSIDESFFQTKTIMSYIVPAGEQVNVGQNNYEEGYIVYLQSNDKIILPPDSSFFFYGMYNLKTIEGLENLDTSIVTNMTSMFSYDRSLEQINLDTFDTSLVTSMSYMFYETGLKTLDLTNFNTINVTDMRGIFGETHYLTELIQNFNTSKVTDMSQMFNNSNLPTINIRNFDTSNVINMSEMFSKTNVTEIDLQSFNTENVTDMSNMFYRTKLTNLNISNFDTSNVLNFYEMFMESYDLTNIIYGEKFVKKAGAEDRLMFYNCSANRPPDISWN